MPAIGQSFSPNRVFTGYFMPEPLMDYHQISYGAKMLLMVIYRMIGKNGNAWPSQDYLAAKLGVSDRTVRSYIDELERDGFICTVQRGLGMTNTYAATWHPVYEDENVSDPDRTESSMPDRKESSGPTYKTEESQNTRESIEENGTEVSDSLRSSSLTYQQAVSTVEQHFGRKLTSKEKQTLLRAVEYYGADQEECIAIAARHGITKNGNGKMRRSASEEYEGGSTHRFRQSSRPSASNARETAFVERPQVSDEWRNDPEYMRYLNALGSTGKRIDPKYASPAYDSLWQRLSEQEKALSIEDAAYIANERRNKPEIIPNPLDHLSAKPWQALRPNKAAGTRQGETKEERNARIYAEYLKEKDRGKIVSNGTR